MGGEAPPFDGSEPTQQGAREPEIFERVVYLVGVLVEGAEDLAVRVPHEVTQPASQFRR